VSDRGLKTAAVDDLRRAALFMVAAAFLFSLMGLGVKLASARLPNAMVVFFRNALSLLALLPWALRQEHGALRTTHLPEHLVRGIAGLLSMYCFFYALAHLRLADAVLLNYSLPLFMPFVESLWLKEAFPRRLWTPILVGFVGIVLILKPGMGLFQPAALVGMAAALFASVAQVGVRRLTHSEPITRIVFYFGVIATGVSALPLLGSWVTPSPREMAVLGATAVFATAAQLLMTRAYAHAPAARVGPFIYTAVVFAGALDWMVWGRLPDRLSLAGTLVVGVAGILALRRRRMPAAPVPSEGGRP
jgi:drug/metabolite transporter (DMT)-like permease